MKKLFKIILFIVAIVAIILGLKILLRNGKFSKLEGFKYSLAGEIETEATDCDATSSDATSSDATSSNATSSDATSSNATSSEIKVTNSPETRSNTKKIANDNEVTFLESHKMYIIIIALSVIAILFIIVILILDKKTKGKAYKQK